MTLVTTSTTLKRARTACASLSLAAATAVSAAPAVVPGALLRQGTWSQGVGSYGVPQAWEKLPARSWPMDGWATLIIDNAAATLTVQPLASAAARQQLNPIVDQLEAAADPSAASASEPVSATPDIQDQVRIPAYIRVPGLTWHAHTVALYRLTASNLKCNTPWRKVFTCKQRRSTSNSSQRIE